jgi:hypothetical protein
MDLFGYVKVGRYIYEAYNDGKFNNMINKFAYNYPTFYGRIDNFLHAAMPHSTYGYTRTHTGSGHH